MTHPFIPALPADFVFGVTTYLGGHLAPIGEARRAGVDVRGCFHWSLMDSWEWPQGSTERFGLVRVEPGGR